MTGEMVLDGAKIRKLREDAGMTLTQLAEVAAISQSMMGYIETNRRDVSVSTVKKIADHFGVGVDDLFKK